MEGIPIEQFIQDTEVENLRVITSGPIPPNPSELLGSARMQDILNNLVLQTDYLIIDVPPAVAVTDASVLAAKVDGIMLVLDAGTVRPEMAQKGAELLRKANGHLLGVILNRVEIEAEHAYYYYYYGNDKKGAQ